MVTGQNSDGILAAGAASGAGLGLAAIPFCKGALAREKIFENFSRTKNFSILGLAALSCEVRAPPPEQGVRIAARTVIDRSARLGKALRRRKMA